MGEVCKPTRLYNDDGTANYGWSKHPVYEINLEKAHFMRFRGLQKLRTKKWDYYYVFTGDFYFCAALVNAGYLGMVFVYFYDYLGNRVTDDSLVIPFASGFKMAENSGCSCFENAKAKLVLDSGLDSKRIILNYPGFNKGEGVETDITLLDNSNMESICTAAPAGKNRASYTRKACCMPASGFIKRGKTIAKLNPQIDFGGLDWNRGFPPYNTFWNWACISTSQDGHRIGLNLCRGLNEVVDTENAFFIDGKCYKVDYANFKYDEKNLLKPWEIDTDDGYVRLSFTPDGERVERTNVLVIKNELHQIFGRFTGTFIKDDETRLNIKDLRGVVEEQHAKW